MSARSFHNLLVHLFPDAGRIEINVLLLGVLHRLLHGEEVLRYDAGEPLGRVRPVGEQVGRERGTGLLGVLEEQDDVAAQPLSFEQQRKPQQGRSMPVVPAQVPCAAGGGDRVVVGAVTECEPIEGTHLHLCKVDCGEYGKDIQICTGADNVYVGMHTPAALAGSRLPD